MNDKYHNFKFRKAIWSNITAPNCVWLPCIIAKGRIAMLALPFLILVFASPTLAGMETQALNIHYQKGFLSVSAHRAGMGDVLGEIGRQSGISVESSLRLDNTVSIQFAEQPLEEGLKRILKNYSYSLLYRKHIDPSGREKFVASQLVILTHSAKTGATDPSAVETWNDHLDNSAPLVIDYAMIQQLLEDISEQDIRKREAEIQQLLDMAQQNQNEINQLLKQALEGSGDTEVIKMFGLENLLQSRPDLTNEP